MILLLFQPGSHARELNPHWKNGGTGLPEEEKSVKKSTAGPVAGDGGLSWLRTAYLRFKKQAEEEGKDLEEVVAERWGVSLATILFLSDLDNVRVLDRKYLKLHIEILF